ncbi:MAG: hypothetical protein CVT92_15175 [Bacteroidetes bacterium HGW-Bacteroidetes-1]|nr:MAG: hypothetical protein CVT92_15175 [Bacteroidetes bacterium HGW-Bacteroidetes-1]
MVHESVIKLLKIFIFLTIPQIIFYNIVRTEIKDRGHFVEGVNYPVLIEEINPTIPAYGNRICQTKD